MRINMNYSMDNKELFLFCLFRWGESCKVTDKDILYVGLDKSVQEWFNNYELTFVKKILQRQWLNSNHL